MSDKDISVFVDESGSFAPDSNSSRYYLICLVLHDQAADISGAVSILEDSLDNVQPESCRLFQAADALCTLELARLKLQSGERLSPSEFEFFKGIQGLRKNYLKPISAKLWR